MTSIVATTAGLVVPGQVRAVGRTGSDSDSASPAAFMDMVPDPPKRPLGLRAEEGGARALTPTTTPPLAPSTLAVMIEMQAYGDEPHRAGVRDLERRLAKTGWDVEGEMDGADEGEAGPVPAVAARAYGLRRAA